MIEFTVAGEPKSKGRPRFSKHGHAYTPKTTRDAEAVVLQAWQDSGGQKLNGPVVMECVFYLGSKRRKDLDNVGKLVMDALNKHAFDDDDQVVRIVWGKVFTSPDEARSVVRVYQFMGDGYE
jgi:Holliday junction resolvase RusA-like endonuclease